MQAFVHRGWTTATLYCIEHSDKRVAISIDYCTACLVSGARRRNHITAILYIAPLEAVGAVKSFSRLPSVHGNVIYGTDLYINWICASQLKVFEVCIE